MLHPRCDSRNWPRIPNGLNNVRSPFRYCLKSVSVNRDTNLLTGISSARPVQQASALFFGQGLHVRLHEINAFLYRHIPVSTVISFLYVKFWRTLDIGLAEVDDY